MKISVILILIPPDDLSIEGKAAFNCVIAFGEQLDRSPLIQSNYILNKERLSYKIIDDKRYSFPRAIALVDGFELIDNQRRLHPYTASCVFDKKTGKVVKDFGSIGVIGGIDRKLFLSKEQVEYESKTGREIPFLDNN